MNDRGPIVVPLDGSELAEGALPLATEIAHAAKTHLVLVSVWEAPGSATPAAISMAMEEHGRSYFATYLHGVRERLAQREIRTIVRCGDPCESILEAADEVGARMIVAGTHGRSGIGRWVYGSTTSRLLRESRIPVLAAGPKVLQPNAPRRPIRHVMVPLDGSEMAEIAIGTAVEMAVALGAKLSLVRAVGWAFEAYPYAGALTYIPSLDTDLERGAREYIARCEASVAGSVEVTGTVTRGASADSLLQFEEQAGVDLVVMATHARVGVARAALGSTADRLIQGPAPVLLLRPRHDQSRETPSGEAESVTTASPN
jgi:nucleotide-binding universal stress UspA family protein